jgi:hypothetical protein
MRAMRAIDAMRATVATGGGGRYVAELGTAGEVRRSSSLPGLGFIYSDLLSATPYPGPSRMRSPASLLYASCV